MESGERLPWYTRVGHACVCVCVVFVCVCVCVCVRACVYILDAFMYARWYGVATIRRLQKLLVSFAKEPYKTDYILQKRPIILRSLLIVATP